LFCLIAGICIDDASSKVIGPSYVHSHLVC
jgi:hypothetical protein